MSQIRPEDVIPKDPSFMSDKEFLRSAEYQLQNGNHLSLEWQKELVERLSARVGK